jgi:Apea-like HEPN
MGESVVRIYKGTLRSSALILGEGKDCKIVGDANSFSKIYFGVPTKIENKSFRTWDGVMFSPLYDIPVELEFSSIQNEKPEDELELIGHKKLENLAARISFIASAPVEVLPNAGLEPLNNGTRVIDGVIHHRSVYVATEFGQFNPTKTVNNTGLETFKGFFYYDKLGKAGHERIERSLRWLLHSYKASTVIDEFISLMIAFEAISELLNESGETESFWECKECEKEFKECPNCGASTGFDRPGNKRMQEFVVNHLKWSKRQWNNLWSLRSKISHGSKDISFEEEQQVAKSIGQTERAVNSALSFLMGLPVSFPVNLRARNWFQGKAKMIIDWRDASQDQD